MITNEEFKMHFYVSVDQIKKGERGCSPMKSLQKEISVPGSLKDLNGGSGRNRTGTAREDRGILSPLCLPIPPRSREGGDSPNVTKVVAICTDLH